MKKLYKNAGKGLIFLSIVLLSIFTNSPGAGTQESGYLGNGSYSMPGDYIPNYAFERAEQYKNDFLREHFQAASDLQYRFFYDQSGNACLEFTVTPKGSYTWSTPVWVGYRWGNGTGSIGLNQINYTITKKAKDEAQYRIEQRRKDPVFREIERVILQIATDYDYDYESAFGIRVKYRRSNIRKAVCEGYADAVLSAFKNHSLVTSVEKWSSTRGGHAWNVLVLKDGRKLYCDATWYDGNSIDNEGYVVNIPEQDPVNLTFDIAEFNSLGGAINTATGKLLAIHSAWGDAKIVGRY